MKAARKIISSRKSQFSPKGRHRQEESVRRMRMNNQRTEVLRSKHILKSGEWVSEDSSGLRKWMIKGTYIFNVRENRAVVGSACCKCVERKRTDLTRSAHQDSSASWKGTENARCENVCIFDSRSSRWLYY